MLVAWNEQKHLIFVFIPMQWFVFLFCFLGYGADQSHDLEVSVTGFSSDKGQVYVGLFNKAEDFAIRGKQFKGKVSAIEGKKAVVRFEDLPTGNYAIASFHDKNKNGFMDKNVFGLPLESYGFSNQARGTLGPPSFSDAKVRVEKDQKIEIRVK